MLDKPDNKNKLRQYNGILHFIEEIKKCESAGANMAVVALIFIGIDTMAYLAMPNGRNVHDRQDFIKWANRYIRAHPEQPYQYSGKDLYGARCSVLHSFGARSSFHDKNRDAIWYVYHNGGQHYASVANPLLVHIGIKSFISDFINAVDDFLKDVENDLDLRRRVETRLLKMYARVVTAHGAGQSAKIGWPARARTMA